MCDLSMNPPAILLGSWRWYNANRLASKNSSDHVVPAAYVGVLAPNTNQADALFIGHHALRTGQGSPAIDTLPASDTHWPEHEATSCLG